MKEYDRVRLLVDLTTDAGEVIPAGTVGPIVDADQTGYAVDVTIDGEFYNVHADQGQIELVSPWDDSAG